MSDGFGLGDGMNDLTHTIAMTDAKVAEARRTSQHTPDAGRWPGPSRLFRVIGSVFLALVVGGLLITLVTAAR